MDAEYNSDWDFYFCHIEDQPASIRVDLGLARHAPLEGLNILIGVRLPLLNPDEYGLVPREEFDAVSAVEDALESGLSGGGARYAGCVTTGGMREFFLYGGGDTDWEVRAAECLAAFPGYACDVRLGEDAEWGLYFNVLYPSREDMSIIMNNRVRRQLDEQGDIQERPREIDHFLYFPSREAAEAAAQKAREGGFSVPENGITENEGERSVWGLRLTRVDPVVDINEITAGLLEMAQELDGDYDGWGCSVCKE